MRKHLDTNVRSVRAKDEEVNGLKKRYQPESRLLGFNIIAHYLCILVLTTALVACAQAPVRRLPIADDIPAKPAGADGNVTTGDLVSFYSRAAALTTSPPDLARYGIECSVPLTEETFGNNHFTLARLEIGRSFLFVFSKQMGPVTDLEKVVSFGGQQGGRSLSWGFLYDRNGDGWVDYFTFVDGAGPVKTDEITGLVPKKPGAKRFEPIRIDSREELELMIKRSRLVFTHQADDNFDGKSDGVVAALWDLENPVWFYGNAVLRSRAFTQVIDEDWRFVTDIRTRSGPVPRSGEKFEVSFFTGGNPLEASSQLLNAINRGIRSCRIPKGALPRE